MIPRPLFLALLLALTAVASARAADLTRFSQALAISERAEIGFNRLSSDQVAVLDALVRRDLGAKSSSRPKDPVPAARFSQRLTANERATAGLAIFSEKELERLDVLVEQHDSSVLARELLAPPTYYPTGMRPLPSETKNTPEVHGSFTLGFGMGKGGYSERFGGINLNYEDPVHHFAVDFSYSESRVKGPVPYRDDYIPTQPYIP
jgi:hypothetical protein